MLTQYVYIQVGTYIGNIHLSFKTRNMIPDPFNSKYLIHNNINEIGSFSIRIIYKIENSMQIVVTNETGRNIKKNNTCKLVVMTNAQSQ